MILALGTHVTFTHTAWIVRERGDKWFIPIKGNYTRGPQNIDGTHLIAPREKANRSVMEWEIPGSGIIIGRERKIIGRTMDGRGGEDYEPGYLQAEGHVDLYVVKADFRSSPSYVPENRIHPTHIPLERP